MKKLSTHRHTQEGFTIVELLISTIIFSLILLGAMAALVQIGRLYYNGITTARTQEQARGIVEEVAQSIKFSSQEVNQYGTQPAGPEIATGDPDVGIYCIGPQRYTYAIDRKLSLSPSEPKERRHVLWVDEPDGGCAQADTVYAADLTKDDPCDRADPGPEDDCSNGRELLGENMRLSRFSLNTSPGVDSVVNIFITVVYGDDDLLEVIDGRYVCEGNRIGSEFCALSELSTSALKRI